MLRTIVSALFVCLVFFNQLQAKGPLVPKLDGPMWQVAGNPDLGELTSEKQQPVDFGVWQAADGTWQLWSCIHHTKCGGKTRLFHCWEGKNLTDKNWKPMGVAMTADPSLGEQAGGLQAPMCSNTMASMSWPMVIGIEFVLLRAPTARSLSELKIKRANRTSSRVITGTHAIR